VTRVDDTEFGRECNFEDLRCKAQTNESKTETDTDDEAQAIQLCSMTRQCQALTNRQDPHDAQANATISSRSAANFKQQ
jgi:hypothetical protein